MSASQEMSEESKELKFLLLMKETDSFRTKSQICTICVDLSQPIKWHHTSGSLISDRISLIKRESQKQSQHQRKYSDTSASEEPDVCVFLYSTSS